MFMFPCTVIKHFIKKNFTWILEYQPPSSMKPRIEPCLNCSTPATSA